MFRFLRRVGGITPTGTAIESDVLEGTSFSNASGISKNGSMPENGNVIKEISHSDQILNPGHYSGLTFKGSANLIASNLMKDIIIGDVTGSHVDNPVSTGDALPSDVRNGKGFSNSSNTGLTGTMVDSATATAIDKDILINKKAVVNDAMITGSMSENGSLNSSLTSQGQSFTIPSGHTSGGAVNANISNLSASTIIAGQTVGGIIGTATNDGTATTGDIANTKIAYVNGVKLTGTAKRSLSGTAVSDGTGHVIVSGLSFTPNKISLVEDTEARCTSTYNKDISAVNYTYTYATGSVVHALADDGCSISSNGFNLKVYQYSENVHWFVTE